nr:MAG TPA: hypothetical protein [Caudoviricetes sp.]
MSLPSAFLYESSIWSASYTKDTIGTSPGFISTPYLTLPKYINGLSVIKYTVL